MYVVNRNNEFNDTMFDTLAVSAQYLINPNNFTHKYELFKDTQKIADVEDFRLVANTYSKSQAKFRISKTYKFEFNNSDNISLVITPKYHSKEPIMEFKINTYYYDLKDVINDFKEPKTIPIEDNKWIFCGGDYHVKVK